MFKFKRHTWCDFQAATRPHIDVTSHDVYSIITQLFNTSYITPYFTGAIVNELMFKQGPFKDKFCVYIVREQVWNISNFCQVVAVIAVKYSAPNMLFILVTKPIVATVQLSIGLNEMGAKLVA
jgi:hypothetical protein